MGNLPAPYAGGQVASGGQVGLLGNRSVMDTPFNQTSYTSQLIQDQQAKSLTDVLDNDPSVRANQPAGNGFEAFYIRGFNVSTGSIGFNGLYGLGTQWTYTGLESVERVEVLKGPGTLVTGMPPFGDVGGSVNLVTKRAGDQPLAQLTTTYVSNSQFGTNIDVGQRYGEHKEFGVRFNGTVHGGNTPVDGQRETLGGASLGLDYRGDRLRVSVDLGYHDDEWRAGARPVLTWGGLTAIPAAPNATTNLNPAWSFSRQKGSLAIAQGEFDIANNVTAYAAVGITDNYLRYAGINARIINPQGDFISTFEPKQDQRRQNIAAQTGIRSVLNTGPVEHAINVNVSTANQSYWGGGASSFAVIASNIYNPVFGPEPAFSAPTPRVLKNYLEQTSVGVADTMSILDKRVQLTVGVRRQSVLDSAYDPTGTFVATGYDQYAWSPAYALVIKPVENVSLYANYIEGLTEGTVVPDGFANANAIIPPFHSTQKEAGIKIDWGRITTTASVFEIAQPALQVYSGIPLPTYAANGTNVNRGLELNVFGKVTDQVRLLGGVVFYDSKLKGTDGGLQDGNRFAGIPEYQLNIGAEWDTPFLAGFTLTGRAIHTAGAFADNANTLFLPSWTRFDLGARYAFASPWNRKPIIVRFTAQNAFGANYWQSAGDNTIFLGTPRTYLVSTTFNF